MKRILTLFLALLMVLSLCACGEDTPPTKEEMLENAETAYLNDLMSDFRNNVIAAKDKYARKPFIVPGLVAEIREDSCLLHYSYPVQTAPYFVKANIPVDELKELNAGDLIRVVGIIADGMETEEASVGGDAYTRNCITMENAHFVDRITEVSGTIHVSEKPISHLSIVSIVSHYIVIPFLTGDSDKIKLISSDDYDLLMEAHEGTRVTISASDIRRTSSGEYEVTCRYSNTRIEKVE